MQNIRNFVIIAHIDHGKSTLADRLLEVTGAVEKRLMRAQYLDQLDLERERGITIKMAPVRMSYTLNAIPYTLNLIDTPGHSDFSYEVSRALMAVEGAILLVDATKGIQAQTLSNFRFARKAGLTIVGAVNKIDMNPAGVEEIIASLAELIDTTPEDIVRVSAKTGEGVPALLEKVIERVPPPTKSEDKDASQALIFDSLYHDHKGIVAYVRVREGEFKGGDDIRPLATNARFKTKEVGFFMPAWKVTSTIHAGEIGYIATGLKEAALVHIGDTLAREGAKGVPLPGYREPTPVVFIAFYPDGGSTFEDLKTGLDRLRLTDAALNFEPDSNEALGRGLKVGFLGQLHFEITASRLKDEFGVNFLTSFPSIAYRVQEKGVWRTITQPQDFPSNPDKIMQPMVNIEILTPERYMSAVVNLKHTYAFNIQEIKNIGKDLLLEGTMPLAELIRDFDDRLKSVSAGYASFSYELGGEEEASVDKMEILVAEEVVPALTRVVSRREMEHESRETVARLKDLLPQQQFSQAIQARVGGRIIARETIGALKKKLGDFGKNGGDITRKMKLWRKQDRGKERLQAGAHVNIPPEVFREILKK
ncbi:MAG: translation elongation factor 4 [bacterium]|nr:translation elongation factor 4 [bacterium]